ncbi:hypothetical protein CEXT_485361 [Caerostris extrusa]|uniref:Uncharacterized protein n=1 Tax=Caerostris extrusa TaxID=172846 RepID=A0AAV4XWQ5_CAEEX|nr:hypothetical protein CEXT_485361 [Caerostris extrusa]
MFEADSISVCSPLPQYIGNKHRQHKADLTPRSFDKIPKTQLIIFWRGFKTCSNTRGQNRGSLAQTFLYRTQAEQSCPHRVNNSVKTLFRARLFESEVKRFRREGLKYEFLSDARMQKA